MRSLRSRPSVLSSLCKVGGTPNQFPGGVTFDHYYQASTRAALGLSIRGDPVAKQSWACKACAVRTALLVAVVFWSCTTGDPSGKSPALVVELTSPKVDGVVARWPLRLVGVERCHGLQFRLVGGEATVELGADAAAAGKGVHVVRDTNRARASIVTIAALDLQPLPDGNIEAAVISLPTGRSPQIDQVAVTCRQNGRFVDIAPQVRVEP